MPDAPDAKGYCSYVFNAADRLDFMKGEGQAVAEYASYKLGFHLLSDPSRDGAERIIEAGSFRILSEPEQWARLKNPMPMLRATCHRTIEEAEKDFTRSSRGTGTGSAGATSGALPGRPQSSCEKPQLCFGLKL